MDWLLFLMLPGALLVWGQSHMKDSIRKPVACTSCDEFDGKTCRRNLGVCKPKYPDFACQTKEIYTQRFTGEYLYRYSVLGCPKRCAEYVRVTRWEKNIFFCCNENYCNALSVKDAVTYNPFPAQIFA